MGNVVLNKPMLENEFKYYVEHQDDLVKTHFGRYIIIKGNEVLGDFSSEIDAIKHARAVLNLDLGTFLVQHCMPGKENYTNFFHSRVSF
jgi:hypothetical protein